jgi:hypothetical protein
MSNLAQLLTIIITALGILAIAWKVFRTLNRLMDLPDKIPSIMEELRKINGRLDELRGEARMWRKQHMRREHRDTD